MIAVRLGTPAEFAAELRAAAGFQAAGPARRSGAGAVDRLLAAARRLRANPRSAAVLRTLGELAPIWWLARAYVAGGAIALIAGIAWSIGHPELPRFSSGTVTLLVFAALAAGSLWLGVRGRRTNAARPAIVAANVALAIAAIPVAAHVLGTRAPVVQVFVAMPADVSVRRPDLLRPGDPEPLSVRPRRPPPPGRPDLRRVRPAAERRRPRGARPVPARPRHGRRAAHLQLVPRPLLRAEDDLRRAPVCVALRHAAAGAHAAAPAQELAGWSRRPAGCGSILSERLGERADRPLVDRADDEDRLVRAGLGQLAQVRRDPLGVPSSGGASSVDRAARPRRGPARRGRRRCARSPPGRGRPRSAAASISAFSAAKPSGVLPYQSYQVFQASTCGSAIPASAARCCRSSAAGGAPAAGSSTASST